MQVVPLQPVPSQQLTIVLGDQICQVRIKQQVSGIYCDLYVSNSLIVGAVLCQNLNRIVRDDYRGFVGDLCFIDNQGSSDPIYTDLGGRFTLVYLEPQDLP